jgi:hypothetical protein
VTRRDFQALSAIRLREARALLKTGNLEGAYYLAGYAVECALKACVAKKTLRHEFPDQERAKASYSHKFAALVMVAGLHEELSKQIQADREFLANWSVVLEWSEVSRYDLDMGRYAAVLVRAISDRSHGVLRWIRQHW